MTNAQITSSYDNNSHINPTAFTLKIYSPDNQTAYSIMPLNFTVYWTKYPTFTFPIPPAPRIHAEYTYTIDNYPSISVTSNQSLSDMLKGDSNFTINPTFSYLVNVSKLTNGYHEIVITASLYGDENLFFNASSSPIQFLVQNSVPTRTTSPSGNLISLLMIPIIVISIVLVLVIITLLLYRRHRKTPNLGKLTFSHD
jgi:hypothetical protein